MSRAAGREALTSKSSEPAPENTSWREPEMGADRREGAMEEMVEDAMEDEVEERRDRDPMEDLRDPLDRDPTRSEESEWLTAAAASVGERCCWDRERFARFARSSVEVMD